MGVFFIVAAVMVLAEVPTSSWAQRNQLTGIQSVGWSRQGELPWGFVTYDVIAQPMFARPLAFNIEEQRVKREAATLHTTHNGRPKRHMGGMSPYGMGGMYPYGMGGRYPHGMYGHGMAGMGGMGGMGGIGMGGSSAEASASAHSSSGGMGYGGMGYPYYKK